ncbi:unnamed protein product [Brachionus calyciflorus]|uniref:Uncharacterized protein n=1 Tax=Brachionus calyciflorus TaxID=104777 RepID=A0A814BD62_9BILA|nr:unnamed protein product [Brachionus calyciflorus]
MWITLFSMRSAETHCNATGKTNGETIGEQYDFEILNEVHIDIESFHSDILILSILLSIRPNLNYSDEVLAKLPSYEADRLVINREKKKSRPQFPLEPSSLTEKLIPETLQFTKKGENFLLYDSGNMNNERS